MQTQRTILIYVAIFALALSRLIPHPPNFAPIMAIALFGGAVFTDRRLAFLVPMAAMLVSDLILGLHAQMWLVYGCFAIVVSMGMLLGRRGVLPLLGATLAGSVLFFLATNLGVWAFSGLYLHDMAGLVACYSAAIPFFHNSLLGNLFFVSVLFGGLAMLEQRFHWAREAQAYPA